MLRGAVKKAPQPLERSDHAAAEHDGAVGRALRDELDSGHAPRLATVPEAQIKMAYEECVTQAACR